ncbi:MAG: sigma-70 family RNA polymerase sigma factor [Myxococcota bacterium]
MTEVYDSIEASYRAHAEHLWGLAYRMLGVKADADEVVQDAYVRFLRSPPTLEREVRPWLVRVTMNLARDRLRRRRSRAYVGPWLPAPVDTTATAVQTADALEARYSQLESLSMSFLLAAETLTDEHRAVLVMRDVFGYSVRETAEALSLSESNVKVIAHRVRAAMRGWESEQRRRLEVPHERVVEVMRRFFLAVASGDRVGAAALLADDVRLLSDGGGQYFAARKPVLGAERVAQFYVRLSQTLPPPTGVSFVTLAGQPAVLLQNDAAGEQHPPLVCLSVELAEDGRITNIYSVLAPDKVAGLVPSV